MGEGRAAEDPPATDADAIVAPYEPEQMAFCRAEFDRLFVDDPQMQALLDQFPGEFIPNGSLAASRLLEATADHLRRGKPLSMQRVGNGEGNAVSMASGSPTRTQARAFYNEFVSQNGVAVPMADAVSLCADVRRALANADVLGYRTVRPDRATERELIIQAIERDDAYAALGQTYARSFVSEGLARGYLRATTITTAWIHLDLLPVMDRLLEIAEAVVVISGRGVLEAEFRARLGRRLRDFVAVPVQGSRPSTAAESHFVAVYPAVRAWLETQDLAGTLVLVGAGLFGKVYIDDARDRGAVALDLGSSFDVLAGLATRPVHSRLDIAALSWVRG